MDLNNVVDDTQLLRCHVLVIALVIFIVHGVTSLGLECGVCVSVCVCCLMLVAYSSACK